MPAEDLAGRYPVWLPMTSMPRYLHSPVTVARASGATIVGEDGRSYLSGNAALWNVACGFDEPRIVRAITEQLQALPYSTLFRFAHEPALTLATRLLELAPGGDLSSVFYGTSGASGVDAALKLARRHHRLTGAPQRRRVAYFADSYHGTLSGPLAVTGEDLEQEEYLTDRRDTLRLPTPEDAAGAAAALALLEEHADEVAALIAEPILGSAGVVDVHPDFWTGLEQLRGQQGLLFIADEVATGFGRTGTMFACDQFGLSPDLMVLSKAINGGYLPLSAVLVSERIASAFDQAAATFFAGETQAGNPLACAAANATLDVLRDDNLVAVAAEQGRLLRERLAGLVPLADGQVQAVTGRGLMIGVHLRGPSGRPDLAAVNQICERFRTLGVIVHPSPRGFSLFPPFRLTEAEQQVLLDAVATVLEELELP